jgi:hypothetical protein
VTGTEVGSPVLSLEDNDDGTLLHGKGPSADDREKKIVDNSGPFKIIESQGLMILAAPR